MASAKGQRQAAQWIAAAQDANKVATTKQLEGYNTQGLEALGQGYQTAEQKFGEYLPKTLDALGTGYTTGRADLNAGYAQAGDAYRQGIAGLDPYAARGNAAGDMHANSLGLNGAAGNQAATGAFQAGPGYQWQVDQATDAAARKASALGITASGNTLDAITRLGSNLANQEYGNWQTQLNGLGQQGQAAATSQLGAYQGLGNLSAQQGSALATLGQNYGQNQASAYNDAGKTLASLGYSQGKDTAGLYQGLGNTLAGVNQNAVNQTSSAMYSAGAASDAARNANGNLALGLAGQVLGLGVGGGQTVGGSIFSGLGKLFG